MKIYDVLVKQGSYKRWDGTFGLEIEAETKEDYNVPVFKFWNIHNDNSLRGVGREYVLNAPMKYGAELDAALAEFSEKTAKIPFIKNSNSTSVHVHVNMLNEDFTTFGNFITAYTLTENILVRYSGESRLSNLFCLPIVDAEDTSNNIKKMFQNFEKKNFKYIQNFSPDVCKYAALNLSSLPRFGSLEIRTFRGTTDTNEIRDWVGILNNILNYSRTSNMTPHDIVLDYKNRGPEVLTDIFGEYRGRLRYGDEDGLLKKSLFYASSNAWSVKDWKKLDEEPKAAVNRKSIDLDKLAMASFGAPFAALDGNQQEGVVREMERLVNRPFVDEFGEEWAAPELNEAAARPLRPDRIRIEDIPPPIPARQAWQPLRPDGAQAPVENRAAMQQFIAAENAALRIARENAGANAAMWGRGVLGQNDPRDAFEEAVFNAFDQNVPDEEPEEPQPPVQDREPDDNF